jgi:hypothetical protein
MLTRPARARTAGQEEAIQATFETGSALARVWALLRSEPKVGISRPPPHRRRPRRPLHSAEDALGDRLTIIAELADDDLHLVLSFIDALVTKNRLRALAGGIN